MDTQDAAVAAILVVEDDPATRALVCRFLERQGHFPITASDGEEALEILERVRVDAILLDVNLPGIDGIEVARRVKSDERTRTIPIIVLTGLPDEDLRLEALEAGAEELLAKPFDRVELITRVRNLLRLKAYTDALQSQNERLNELVDERTEQIATSERFLRNTLDALSAPIVILDGRGYIVETNTAWREIYDDGALSHPEHGIGRPYTEIHQQLFDADVSSFVGDGMGQVLAGERPEVVRECTLGAGSASRHFVMRITHFVEHSDSHVVIAHEDVTRAHQAAEKLREVHRQLVEASRMAGMAEIATSVLHDAGNVLNSINVTTATLVERVDDLPAEKLRRLVDLLDEHDDDLARFLTEDERGRLLPRYLRALADTYESQKSDTQQYLEVLYKHVEHLREIVKMQQTYAKQKGSTELLSLDELVDEVLRLHEPRFARRDITIERDLGTLPASSLDRNRLLQILINLVNNAFDALISADVDDRRLVVRTRETDDGATLELIDNGVGIAPTDLPNVFKLGFTTKSDGHGFGLYSSALAARKMGGQLLCHSDGKGKGTTFMLELPQEGQAVAAGY